MNLAMDLALDSDLDAALNQLALELDLEWQSLKKYLLNESHFHCHHRQSNTPKLSVALAGLGTDN